jgi:hypothetical protein
MTDIDLSVEETEEEIREAIAARPRHGRPPGQPGTVNRDIRYKCDVCHVEVGRENLVTRQVVFLDMITKRRVRTRTVEWVCKNTCLPVHPDYVREKLIASPGMRDVAKR